MAINKTIQSWQLSNLLSIKLHQICIAEENFKGNILKYSKEKTKPKTN